MGRLTLKRQVFTCQPPPGLEEFHPDWRLLHRLLTSTLSDTAYWAASLGKKHKVPQQGWDVHVIVLLLQSPGLVLQSLKHHSCRAIICPASAWTPLGTRTSLLGLTSFWSHFAGLHGTQQAPGSITPKSVNPVVPKPLLSQESGVGGAALSLCCCVTLARNSPSLSLRCPVWERNGLDMMVFSPIAVVGC